MEKNIDNDYTGIYVSVYRDDVGMMEKNMKATI